MKIGIIIHSHTGNTLTIGEALQNTLLAKGCTVSLERVIAVNEDPNTREKISLKAIPDIASYDTVILGAPVRALSLSPVMKAYLSQLADLHGKNIACFVTQQFPKPWMGGTRAIKQMLRAVEEKGATITDTGIINWSSKTREELINDVVLRLCRNLKAN